MTHRWRERRPGFLGGLGAGPQARAVLALGAVLGVDGADKGAMSVAAGGVKSAFHVGNTEVGLLVSVVSVTAAVFTVPVGLLTDRVRRVTLLTVSTSLWAAATFLSGFASSYGWLLAARAGLGAVAATAGPTVASLTGDFVPARSRARMLGLILGGELVGAGLGFLISSVVTQMFGWRFAFWWLVVPGIAVVWVVARLPEPERAGQGTIQREPSAGSGAFRSGFPPAEAGGGGGGGESDRAGRAFAEAAARPEERLVLREDPRGKPGWWSVRYVLRVRTNLVLIVASGLGYFYFAGLRTFAVVFVTGQYGVSTSVAGSLVLWVGVGALTGVFMGGRFADRLLRSGRISARVVVPSVCLAAVPLFFAPALYTSSLVAALPLYFVGALLLGAVNPPLDAARLDILHPYLWGTGEGVRTFLRTVGEAAAPTVFGFVSVQVFGASGLRDALLLFLVCLLAAAALGLAAVRTYPRDVATVNASMREVGASSA